LEFCAQITRQVQFRFGFLGCEGTYFLSESQRS